MHSTCLQSSTSISSLDQCWCDLSRPLHAAYAYPTVRTAYFEVLNFIRVTSDRRLVIKLSARLQFITATPYYYSGDVTSLSKTSSLQHIYSIHIPITLPHRTAPNTVRYGDTVPFSHLSRISAHPYGSAVVVSRCSLGLWRIVLREPSDLQHVL